ncbi:cell division cycle protein 48-like protein [Hibiscus syriacus]|uniref:Cell division cycle protein 48-like protein n=1 Tax=Hibiscus syriacus TaxID=106335 RepID=A0A6A3AYW1_HIBSY|nr:cell division cycle protein 48-like protein [Hibiscus syriacus]
MNFNDFFIFISRFSLANAVELYYLHGESNSESSIWHCSATVKHFALNLASIRKIALKMKSEGVEGNLGIINLWETLSDPKFLKLCTGLGRIYSAVPEEEDWSCTEKKVLMADFEKYGFQVCSPEDLVTFIDDAVSKLSSNCNEQNTPVSIIRNPATSEKLAFFSVIPPSPISTCEFDSNVDKRQMEAFKKSLWNGSVCITAGNLTYISLLYYLESKPTHFVNIYI